MSKDLLVANDIHKTYMMGKNPLHVLRGVSLTVRAGEFVAVMGASGSGKSTILHILGALDEPNAGDVIFDGEALSEKSSAARNSIRCLRIGFVFQFYHLMPELNVLENVLFPTMVRHSILGWISQRSSCRARAMKVAESVGLGERVMHHPNELSGGERQRVAIARALVNEPDVLLADEPTGNLDECTGSDILDLLGGLHRRGQAIVMVTHDAKTAGRADRCVHLKDGRIVDAGE
jgi:lipoprotein-releasing system ATP-binding protein